MFEAERRAVSGLRRQAAAAGGAGRQGKPSRGRRRAGCGARNGSLRPAASGQGDGRRSSPGGVSSARAPGGIPVFQHTAIHRGGGARTGLLWRAMNPLPSPTRRAAGCSASPSACRPPIWRPSRPPARRPAGQQPRLREACRNSSRPEHFADPVHGRTYAAIARRIEAGQLADAVTLKAEFEHSGILEEVGGTAYLAQLVTAMVGGDQRRRVRPHHPRRPQLRRQPIDIGETMVNRAFGPGPEEEPLEAREQLKAAEQALFELSKENAAQGGFAASNARCSRRWRRPSAPSPAAPAFSGLLHGAARAGCAAWVACRLSDLIILAGRPGMGKTALATKIAYGAARAILREAREADPHAIPKGGVAIFSLEMSAEQLATRLAGGRRRALPATASAAARSGRRSSTVPRGQPRSQSLLDSSTTPRPSPSRPCARAAGGLAHARAGSRGGGLSAAHAACSRARGRRTGCWRSATSPRAEGDRQGAVGAGARASRSSAALSRRARTSARSWPISR